LCELGDHVKSISNMTKTNLNARELALYLTEIGRRGGKARAKKLTATERKAIAQKAGKASGKARRKKAESA
jgi:hypothetical protein